MGAIMADIQSVIVTQALKGGWLKDKRQSYIDLKIDEDNTLRLTFPDEFPPDLKLSLQRLQGHVAEERKKAGLPVIEHSYIQAVQRLEFGRDDVNQIAIIRTRFQNGGSQDTPIEMAQIQETIEFLKTALQAFESLSKSKKH